MAQTIETTPAAAPPAVVKSAQISDFLRGLGMNDERKLTLKEHMSACFEDFHEAIEVKGYNYDALAQQLAKIGLQVSPRSLRDAYTEVKKDREKATKTAHSASTYAPASGGSTWRKSGPKVPAPTAGD